LASRLRVALDTNGSPEYALIWKKRVMPSGSPICRLRASAPRTSASDCSGWPSPSANGFEPADLERLEERRQAILAKGINGNGFGLTLGQATQLWLVGWASPQASLGGAEPEGKTGRKLTTQIQLVGWPTATVNDSRSGRNRTANRSDPESQHHDGLTLVDAAMLSGCSTPTAQDASNNASPSQQERNSLPLNVQVKLAGWPTSAATDGTKAPKDHHGRNLTLPGAALKSSPVPMARRVVSRLNPAFSLWLMGFPVTWSCFSPGWSDWGRTERLLADFYAQRDGTETAD
jgi:hypothetical protein